MSLSRCGTLCVFSDLTGELGGFDTETFDTVFSFLLDNDACGPPAISQCKTRCYLPCWKDLRKVALPGGEVVRKVEGTSDSVFACGGVVVSKGKDGVSVYDKDLTLLRSLSHEGCWGMAVSDCGGWVITSSSIENTRLWDVNTGEAVACVPADATDWCCVALSRSASVFAVEGSGNVHLFDWSGAALRSVDVGGDVTGMQFTPCGKYLVVKVIVAEDISDTYDEESEEYDGYNAHLHQYDVATMSRVHVIPQTCGGTFAISPCSRVVVLGCDESTTSGIVTRHLYPHNSE